MSETIPVIDIADYVAGRPGAPWTRSGRCTASARPSPTGSSPALRRKLYCLGLAESAKKLEEIVASTDNYAMEAMWEASNYNQQL